MEAGAHWIERRAGALYWLVDAAFAEPLAALSAYCAGDRDLRRALLVHLPREERRVARHRWLYR